ncbi:MAG: peptidase M16 [Bacteroidetes bacterium MedPE-SWsnd-G1]|nr:MAG: peptidase M16 [Bacteroidetes bacterium MedPE-SWsnd-G1]
MKSKINTLIIMFLISICGFSQIDRSKQPKPGPAPEIKLETPDKFKLKNGLTVLIVENHKLPRVSYSLRIDRNPILDGDKSGVSEIMGSMLGNGTTNIPKDQFNEEIDFLGANLSFGNGTAYASSLSKYSDRILELMADATINPLLTQGEFDKEKDLLIEGIKSNEKSVQSVASRVSDALSYGINHPYGEYITEETVNNITLNDVISLNKSYANPSNSYLVVIGDVKTKKIKAAIKKYFGEWEDSEVAQLSIPEPSSNPSATEIDFVDMPNAVQSNIIISNNIKLKKSDPDYFAALIANRILGGGATGYLFQNLRDDHGYTYGSYSRISDSRYLASRFVATAEVRNKVTDSSVVEMLNEVNRIRTEFVSEETLKTAKATYVGSFVKALERPQTIANYSLDIILNELPESFYQEYLQKINNVTKEDVQNAANKYFKADNLRIVIIGKGSDVLPNLEKTGISINYFDTYANASEKPDLSSPIPDGVTVKSVLEGYIEAIGGADKIASIESVVTNYEGTTPMGTIGQIEKRVTDKYAQSTLVNGNAMMGVIATNAEMFMKQGGQKIPLPPTFLEDVKATLGTFYETAILNNPKAELTGIEKVNGKDAYKIEMAGTSMSGTSFYDVETGLKVKETSVINMNGQSQTSDVFYSDYKEVEGVLFANKKSTSFGPQVVELTLKEVLFNEGVSEEDFK